MFVRRLAFEDASIFMEALFAEMAARQTQAESRRLIDVTRRLREQNERRRAAEGVGRKSD